MTEIRIIQGSIVASLFKEAVMISLLNDPALFQDDNPVRSFDSR
jgi:hypothetical protein